jgi:acetolactate synthase I/II/III large subunit
MTGAEALLETLAQGGVEVCFANPGTSEMHLVSAIDKSEKVRSILALFEGVATGGADGYGRMADKPAATLLHLGPGLANGLANLHNAKRANSPIVNIVGDHAVDHLKLDAPLTSDIVGVATPMSHFVLTSRSAERLAEAGAEALAASLQSPGRIATLIVPANHAWEQSCGPAKLMKRQLPGAVSAGNVAEAAQALLSKEPAAILLGGRALREGALEAAGRVAEATGATLIMETFPARLQRGAGRVSAKRIPYFGEMAAEFLKEYKHLIIVGSKAPVSFFAYPDKPSWLAAEGCSIKVLAEAKDDVEGALCALAEAVGAAAAPTVRQPSSLPEIPSGKLTTKGVAACVASLMPENAIVSDESGTSGNHLYPMTAGAAPHDWLTLTGGSIGQGLPVATGAAVACPDRKVLCFSGDGGAMYTVQALWTQAREKLDVTTVIFANHSYGILNVEFGRVGLGTPGAKAKMMLDLSGPQLDWVQLAGGMGVPASRAATVEEFQEQFAAAMKTPGPHLIEAVL